PSLAAGMEQEHLYLSCLYPSDFDESIPPQLHPLSLHDALPIFQRGADDGAEARRAGAVVWPAPGRAERRARHRLGSRRRARERSDRKSTRLNSSHVASSYAVFCLKKKTGTKKGVLVSAVIERGR